MAYYNKYKITYATKTGKTVFLYLQEDLPSQPTIVEYIGIDISLEYLPASDDVFEPIFSSQLNVTIDVTDSIDNIPDFLNINDRKYFAKLYLDSDLEWVGYSLSDNLKISYSTGRKELSFNCTDGIGMLKDIPLPINNVGNRTNDLKSVLYYMQTALNALGFPTNPNLVTVCSYFAGGMTDRSSGSQYEPFSQTYLPIRTFKNDDYTYEKSLIVLEKLLKSFGCRLFQAGGKWWIVAVNEFANLNNWYTEYTYLGVVAASGSTLNTSSTIEGYTNNTSGLYFVDNSQFKLILKGYNRIDFTKDIDYNKNLVDNGNLRIYTGSPTWQPQSWTVFTDGPGASFDIVDNPDNSYAEMRLIRTAGGFVRMINNYMPKVNAGDVFTFSMLFTFQGTGNRGYLAMKVIGDTQTYYLDTTGGWQTSSSNGYIIPAATTNQPNTFTVTVEPSIISGQLVLEFNNQVGSSCTVSEFSLKAENLLENIEYFGYLNNTQQYKKEVDIPFGYNALYGFPLSIGAFVKSDASPLLNWYRYGKPAEAFGSLTLLLFKQYINCLGKNIINIDCSISNFVTTNTNYPYVNASKMIKATDTDPAQINVSTKSYMLGNSTVAYIDNSTNVSLLEISNTDIASTINYKNFFK